MQATGGGGKENNTGLKLCQLLWEFCSIMLAQLLIKILVIRKQLTNGI